MAIRTFRWKRGTAAQWSAENPILEPGEPGFEYDSGKFKVGDGVSPWSALPYFEPGEPPEIEEPENPDEGGDIDATLEAWGSLEFAANTMGYATGNDQFDLTPLTAKARELLSKTSPATMRAVLETYSINEVNSIFLETVPQGLMDHATLTSNWGTSNTAYYPLSNGVTPLSCSVEGENRDVWVEFRALANGDVQTTVQAYLMMNGSYDSPAGALTSIQAYAAYPNEISIKRKFYLYDGQFYTFNVGMAVRGGSYTEIVGHPDYGATLTVSRA